MEAYQVNKLNVTPGQDLHEAVYAFQRQGKLRRSYQQIMASWLNGGHLRLANPDVPEERRLIDYVIAGCTERDIRNIPPIAIGQANIVNAASVGGDIVVFTTEIMRHMPGEELRAVIGHELSHHRHEARDWTIHLGVPPILLMGMLVSKWSPARLLDRGLEKLPTLMEKMPALKSGVLGRIGGSGPARWLGGLAAGIAGFSLDTLALFTPTNLWQLHMEREADQEGADYAGPRAMGDALTRLKQQTDTKKALAEKERLSKPKAPQSLTEYALWGAYYSMVALGKYIHFLIRPFGTHPSPESRIKAMQKRERSEGPRVHANAPEPYKQHVQQTAPGTLIDATQAEREILAHAELSEARANAL